MTFVESGLPSSRSWSVTLNGTKISSTTSTVLFSEPNGTYAFSVGPGVGYAANPSSGPVTVRGGPVSQPIAFATYSSTTYPVTFTESGLPSGTNWSVTLGNNTRQSTISTIVITVPNGTSAYTIPTVAGYAAEPATGNVTVAGSGQAVGVTFSTVPPPKYTVTFTESGLPAGTLWSVTIGGVTPSANTTTITLQEANGTYPYTIGSVGGYTATPSSGSVMVLGGDPPSVAVAFSSGSSGSTPAGGLSTIDWLIIGIVIALIVIGLIVGLARRGGRRRTETITATKTTTEESTSTTPAPGNGDSPLREPR
jgi:hypothetical protein